MTSAVGPLQQNMTVRVAVQQPHTDSTPHRDAWEAVEEGLPLPLRQRSVTALRRSSGRACLLTPSPKASMRHQNSLPPGRGWVRHLRVGCRASPLLHALHRRHLLRGQLPPPVAQLARHPARRSAEGVKRCGSSRRRSPLSRATAELDGSPPHQQSRCSLVVSTCSRATSAPNSGVATNAPSTGMFTSPLLAKAE